MQEPELHDLSDDSDYAASQQQRELRIMSRTDSGKRSGDNDPDGAEVVFVKDNVTIHPTQYASERISGRLRLIKHGALLFMELRIMSRTDSGKRSGDNDPDGAEVVFVKDNVTIHPTQYASERISGRLRLIKHGALLFMTWIPYKEKIDSTTHCSSSNTKLSEIDRNLYTIRAVPVTDIRSIRRHTPTFGWQYLIIVLSSGLAFPPLYFYNGGVREFLATIKQHVFLVRSVGDSNVFLVNDFQDPLQRSLSSLELPRAVSISNTSTPTLASSAPQIENSERIDDGSSSISQYGGRHGPKIHDPARDLSIQVLEKFSLVTKFARETTTHLLREIQNDGFLANDTKKQSQPPSNDNHETGLNDAQSVPNEISVTPDPLEKPLNEVLWLGCSNNLELRACSFDGKVIDQWYELSVYIRLYYLDGRVLNEFWKETHFEEAATRVGTFELVNSKEFDKLTLVWGQPRQPPLGSEEWATFFDAEGRIMDSKSLRKRIFYGGVEHQIRNEVWKFLLGYHEYDSTYAEREYLASVKKTDYETLKSQWQSISPAQARRFTKFRERKGLIEKDVVRTDRSASFYDGDDNPNVTLLLNILLTYSFYNFDLGYCQGMSDLLSPILFVMKDESESFWCFVSLMERLGPNFNRDQNGMHSQLFALSKLVELLDSPLHNYFRQNDCLNYFFCFRWVLIQFKREFDFEKMMRLWEVLWTHYLSEHFHLYVCVAILKKHRSKIIGEQMDFDTLLKFINELSGHIDLDVTIRDAEALCICAGENGAACIPPGTPASLPIETDLLYPLQDDNEI
ncbi:Tbc1 domain family member [Thalictrum thalictroides]|uniref:TBC1 domain family member 15 n=1 Tax=Thalictrum thalictroides TaxID=46969 RepID=A0A7J6UTN8_THATH|nr:Tbc1 domain family member [Thalictrum thalictroides]